MPIKYLLYTSVNTDNQSVALQNTTMVRSTTAREQGYSWTTANYQMSPRLSAQAGYAPPSPLLTTLGAAVVGVIFQRSASDPPIV